MNLSAIVAPDFFFHKRLPDALIFSGVSLNNRHKSPVAGKLSIKQAPFLCLLKSTALLIEIFQKNPFVKNDKRAYSSGAESTKRFMNLSAIVVPDFFFHKRLPDALIFSGVSLNNRHKSPVAGKLSIKQRYSKNPFVKNDKRAYSSGSEPTKRFMNLSAIVVPDFFFHKRLPDALIFSGVSLNNRHKSPVAGKLSIKQAPFLCLLKSTAPLNRDIPKILL